MTKRVAQPESVPAVNHTALSEQVVAALNELRTQLSSASSPGVVLPAALARMLPPEPSNGERVLVDNWRAYEVWAVYKADAWTLEIWQDGILR